MSISREKLLIYKSQSEHSSDNVNGDYEFLWE